MQKRDTNAIETRFSNAIIDEAHGKPTSSKRNPAILGPTTLLEGNKVKKC